MIINTYYRKGTQSVLRQIEHYSKKWLIRTAFALLLATVASQAVWTYMKMFQIPEVIAEHIITKKPDRLEVKIAELKQDVLNKLSACESYGTKEPEAAIILDSNSAMSIGKFMFQIKTIQYYVKKFEDRDITRREAIELAINGERAENLAERIIFEDSKGINNWVNCNKKLGLDKEISLIKKLQ